MQFVVHKERNKQYGTWNVDVFCHQPISICLSFEDPGMFSNLPLLDKDRFSPGVLSHIQFILYYQTVLHRPIGIRPSDISNYHMIDHLSPFYYICNQRGLDVHDNTYG